MKNKTLSSLLAFLFYIGSGIAFYCLTIQKIESALGSTTSDEPMSLFEIPLFFVSFAAFLLFCILLICAAFIFHTILHEAGHLIFGLMSGYKFSSFRIFSLMWQKEEGKIKFKKLSLAGTAGQCLMLPPERKMGKMPFVMYNLGGCIVNFVTSVILLVLGILLWDYNFASGVIFCFSLFGFVLFLINFVPFLSADVDNDGKNTLSASRDPETAQAFWTHMKVNEKMASGERIKDISDDLIYMPTDEQLKNSLFATIGVFYENKLMDMQEFAEAEGVICRLLRDDTGVAVIYRNFLICDKIYLKLIENKLDEARELMSDKQLQKFMLKMSSFPSVARTSFAYELICEENISKAKKTKANFEKNSNRHPYAGDIISERELIALAEERAAFIFEKNTQF